ncbi:MAG: hypothetical protein M2R45_00391 [Verrucomicrobia subdivision 3 bacterium]|nr:hypothetical protein [Limisphaerales bacterium]MCS1412850.1 hypothetical protein [Limisphaerales bacterium]
MPKPRIPKKDITLRPPEEAARLELSARIETILGHAKHRFTLLGAFAFLLLGLLVTGAQNLHQLNTQGIAYILLAKHCASGDFGLAVSSYWSPMLSWCIAVGLKIGWNDPTAARVAMGISGLLFWIAAVVLLFLTQIPARSLLIGAWLTAFAALPWSIEYISPDLLGAALLLLAIATTFYTVRFKSREAAIAAGLFWGLTYYAQAMLLPVIFISLLGFGLIGKLGSSDKTRTWLKSIGLQTAVAVIIMVPWWTVLSLEYGRPTIGTVWKIDHAVAGPPDVDRYHPCFGSFNPPSEGRLTNWEDPARLKYSYWSPLKTRANREHQASLIKSNIKAALSIFSGYGTFGIGILALLSCLVFRPPLERQVLSQTWRWVIVPAPSVVLAFLPVSVTGFDSRFFYVVYPLMLVAALNFIEWLPRQFDWERFPGGFVAAILAILFAIPIIPRLTASLEGMHNPGGYATLELAARMKTANISGTIAGDAMLLGSRTGLYVACLLNESWIGDSPAVVGTDYLSCGADLIIVHRQHRVNSDMEFNPAFRDLDTVLFPDKMQAEQFPLRVYQINR